MNHSSALHFHITMKTNLAHFTSALLGIALAIILLPGTALGQGFTDSSVTFYGEVHQVGGAQTVLLQSGTLEVTFVNQSNPLNAVTLQTSLRPTGSGEPKPYSYALQVPLAYLPEDHRIGESLAIGTQETDFQVQSITINGSPATLPDGSKEFYALSFASRADQYRLDLIVMGDSTDTDGDGLPDWWESQHGLDPNLADATSDLDSDGWSNLDEFKRGSDPAQSNTEPQLATAEILVPEAGKAGLFVHVLDSDTAAADIVIGFAGGAGGGFDLEFDGSLLEFTPGEAQRFSLADLRAGRLTIAHSDRAVRQFSLPIQWDDGGDVSSGAVMVRIASPSSEDGSDASLWLDGHKLPAEGTAIGNWNDRSGNGRHAMQPLADHQPIVRDRAVDFAASNSAHLFFQDSAVPAGDHTILVAFRAADSSSTAQTLLASNRGFLRLAATSEAISYPGAPVYQIDDLAVGGYENVSGTTTTSIFRREGGLLQNIFGLSYDGENIAGEPIDPVLPTIGARRPAIAGETQVVEDAFGGKLSELLVFPSALPEQKLRDVHDYLQSKWSGAVIWDLSTELKDIELSTTGPGRHIIRGGHGDDVIGGGPMKDILSGGAGADTLTGGGGIDRFVFGGVDTGNDVITDFDIEEDVIDLSALFWGQTGDARQFVSVRLDTNFSTPVPTLDSVLLVERPDGSEQEIVLRDQVVGATQLIQLIVEGRLRMGGLSIPTAVQLALGPGNQGAALHESLDQPFTIEVTRSGEGSAAALEVPLGFFEDAFGGDLVLEGAATTEGQRAVVSFERGETSKILTFRPVPDLETEGEELWQIAVLPHFKYSAGGTLIEQVVGDDSLVQLELIEANALAGSGQAARVRVFRDGDLGEPLVVKLQLGGTAEQGVHIDPVAGSVTIAAGQQASEVQITARTGALSAGPKVVLFQISPHADYQIGSPNEAVVYVADTAEEANGAGFDRWLQTRNGGEFANLADLMKTDPESLGRYVRAYAFGLDAAGDLGKSQLALRIIEGRPELLAKGTFDAADVRWGVQASGSLDRWADAGDTFVEVADPRGLRLIGEPLAPNESGRFYRLNFTLEPGPLAGATIIELTGATRFGISGDAIWSTDQATGKLRSSGGTAGEVSRIIAEVPGGAAIDFEMALVGGEGNSLVFYIDGIRIDQTDGASVRVQEHLTGPGAHLLMWELETGNGQALIGRPAGF
ncbi:MAG: hypothetical protein ACI9MB_002885 [Verrucomicrobiales bacterium]|jgi:hypothetical protein